MRSTLLSLVLLLVSSQISWAQFTEVSQTVGINHIAVKNNYMSGGVAILDYDNDGWEDVYMTSGNLRDKLFRNLGNGEFEEVGIAAGFAETENMGTFGVVSGDYDNDGDRDLFVTTQQNAPCYLYRNNGNGTFTNVSALANIVEESNSTSAIFGDYNQDGYLDIYVVNYIENPVFLTDENGNTNGFAHECFPNFLYINNQDGTFTESAAAYGVDDIGCGLAAIFTDYDGDRDADLYVINDFGEWVVPNVLYENQFPSDQFINQSNNGIDLGLYGMGVAVGDYNNDGLLDYYVTNLGRNALLENRGSGVFLDVTAAAGVENTFVEDGQGLLTTGWGTGFFDYDNDTYVDLFVSNGYIPAASFIATNQLDPHKLYRNKGDNTFEDMSDTYSVNSPFKGRGFAYADFDKDGDLDLFVVSIALVGTSTDHSLLYRNDTNNGNNWFRVNLEGTKSNRDAYGSRVELTIGTRKLVRELNGGCSHASQHSSILHFGLGANTLIDELKVIWPDGTQQIETNVSSNQEINIIEEYADLVAIGNGQTIANNSDNPSPDNHTDFGIYEIGSSTPLSRTFLIQNRGNTTLTLTSQPRVEGMQASNFTISSLASLVIAPNEVQSVTVNFTANISGNYETDVILESNDFAESTFQFRIAATANFNTDIPQILVKGNGNTIANNDFSPSLNDHTDFGDYEIGEAATERTFVIRNEGSQTLLLTTPFIIIEGTHASDFNIEQMPATSIAPGNETTFTLSFSTNTTGTKTAALRITSNDPNIPTYRFGLRAKALNLPKMLLLGANGEAILNGQTIPQESNQSDFGQIMQNSPSRVQQFIIRNEGTAPLSLTAEPVVGILGDDNGDFLVISNPQQVIAPNAESRFEVAFFPQSVGQKTAQIIISNNDVDQQPFIFTIGGEVLAAPTATESFALAKVEIFPNPVQDWLQIRGLSSAISDLVLQDNKGKTLQTWQTDNYRQAILRIDLRHLPSALYYLRVSDKQGAKVTYKIIKQ